LVAGAPSVQPEGKQGEKDKASLRHWGNNTCVGRETCWTPAPHFGSWRLCRVGGLNIPLSPSFP